MSGLPEKRTNKSKTKELLIGFAQPLIVFAILVYCHNSLIDERPGPWKDMELGGKFLVLGTMQFLWIIPCFFIALKKGYEGAAIGLMFGGGLMFLFTASCGRLFVVR